MHPYLTSIIGKAEEEEEEEENDDDRDEGEWTTKKYGKIQIDRVASVTENRRKWLLLLMLFQVS